MANFLQRYEFEASAKFKAQQDGRKWEELPDSVKEMYIDKSVQNAENAGDPDKEKWKPSRQEKK